MKTPDAEALVSGDERLTYGELEARADQLAARLRRLGVGPDTLVGVYLERTAGLVVGLLGILKAGGAYVPMDPKYPAERLAFMLADARPVVVLTQESLRAQLPATGAPVVCVDAPDESFIPQAHAGPPPTAANLAYVIYTSGSTGQPKGVAIEHRNAVNFMHWGRSAFSDAELAGVLAATSVCFDLSVFELFVTLSCGGKVILAENALQLPQLAAKAEVTLINTVPSALAELVQTGGVPASVQVVNLAGEPLSTALVDRIYEQPNIKKVNDLYGPTETTTYSTFTLRQRGAPATIGRPLANTRVYVLDEHRQPVPVGVAGELYIGGAGVARGYLNRPELTAEKFLADPFCQEPGARIYKTGDLVRYLADGQLEFLGRLDQQVKIRGYRIELGEIEAVLKQHPALREAVVTARANTAGEKELVAYLVVKARPAPTVGELRSYLLKKLPDYMVPVAYVVLPAFPLTPNGKIDRKALPVPEGEAIEMKQAYLAPGNYLEHVLCNIWREALNLKRVGVRDDFFDLGGHSLLAVRLIREINQSLKTSLHVPTFFKNSTIEQLARVLAQEHRARPEPQLISLQPGQSAGSLFFLEAGMGLCRLAELFDTGPASYATVVPLTPSAFRAASHNQAAGLPSMEELAAPHTALIRKHAHPGPYLIAGHSFGGLLAFEVAHQLQREGRHVEMILLIDTWGRSLPWMSKLKLLTFNSAKQSLMFRANHLLKNIVTKSARAAERLYEKPKPFNHPDSVSDDVNLPFGEVPWEILSEIYRNARKNYVAQPLASRALLFRAQDSELARYYAIDGNMGWGGLFKGGLNIVDSPGDHFTLLKAPHLKFLVKQFQTGIETLGLSSKA